MALNFSLSDFSAHRNGLPVLKELADSACYKATNWRFDQTHHLLSA